MADSLYFSFLSPFSLYATLVFGPWYSVARLLSYLSFRTLLTVVFSLFAFVLVHLRVQVQVKVLSRQLRRVPATPPGRYKKKEKSENGRPAARDFRPANGSLLHGFDYSVR